MREFDLQIIPLEGMGNGQTTENKTEDKACFFL